MLTALRDKKLLIPTVMMLLAMPFLLSLAFWQLDRKAWKDGLLDGIAQRAKLEAVDVTAAYKSVTGDAATVSSLEYTRVKVRGRFHHDKELYYYAPDPKQGPGHHVFTPLEIIPSGTIVFVNRGYVPDAMKSPGSRAPGQIDGDIEVTGLVRAPAAPGQFTPPNEPAKNLWFWRDLDSMYVAAFPKAERKILPLFIDSEADAPGGWPKGGVTELKLTNRHLEYALTWFGLAAALAAIFGMYVVNRLRQNPAQLGPV
jgi:surfeit locus 1 family protein